MHGWTATVVRFDLRELAMDRVRVNLGSPLMHGRSPLFKQNKWEWTARLRGRGINFCRENILFLWNSPGFTPLFFMDERGMEPPVRDDDEPFLRPLDNNKRYVYN